MAPDVNGLPLVAGQQLLTMAGFASSTNPSFQPCTPLGQPRDGTSINTIVLLTKDGTEWVARSIVGAGTIELHFRSTGAAPSGIGVTGTIAGEARDIGLMGVTRDVAVTLGGASGGGAATLEGATASAGSSLIVGRAAGAVRFSDGQGLSSNCPTIQWSMQPY